MRPLVRRSEATVEEVLPGEAAAAAARRSLDGDSREEMGGAGQPALADRLRGQSGGLIIALNVFLLQQAFLG